jgi:hypothetical protein
VGFMIKTLQQAEELLHQMRLEFVPDEDLQVDDILIEKDGKLLVRRSTLTYLAGDYYFGVNYEMWMDREMYERGIYGEYLADDEEVSYCIALAGSDVEEMIEAFKEELENV